MWLLRPDGVIDPLPVSESALLQRRRARARPRLPGPAAPDRARRAGRGGSAAGPAGGAAAAAARSRVRERAGARPAGWSAAALVGAGVMLAVQVVALPFGAWAHERAVDVGPVDPGLGEHGWPTARRPAAIAVRAGGRRRGAVQRLMRRFPRRWWVAGAGAVVAIEVVFVWLAPVVLDPLFNRYEDLPPGRTRAAVRSSRERAGVDVGDVLVVDASRRTTAANAYVDGLGHTKRVVLYDTLLERFDPAQVRPRRGARAWPRQAPRPRARHAVGGDRRAGRDVRGDAAHPALERARRARRRARPASLPALALALALVAFGLDVVSNQLSRAVESRADAYSLELTGEPREFIELERRLALANVTDPDPPGAVPVPVRHPPLDGGADRHRARVRAPPPAPRPVNRSGGACARRRRRRAVGEPRRREAQPAAPARLGERGGCGAERVVALGRLPAARPAAVGSGSGSARARGSALGLSARRLGALVASASSTAVGSSVVAVDERARPRTVGLATSCASAASSVS